MKTFKEIYEGVKFNKAEQLIINDFLLNDKDEMKVSRYLGTGRIKGGGKAVGADAEKAVLSLEKKGIIKILKKSNTITHVNYDIKLVKKSGLSVAWNKKELSAVYTVAINSQDLKKKISDGESDADIHRFASRADKNKSKGDYDIISKMVSLGYLVFDTFEAKIGFTKKGAKEFKDSISKLDYIIY